jgi:hypothetical protein
MEVYALAVQKLKDSDSAFRSPRSYMITGTGGVVGETMEKAEKIRTFEEIMGIENDSPNDAFMKNAGIKPEPEGKLDLDK